jgi:hypothetical protein
MANDAEFQKNVLRQVFGLLETATGPTIADYEGPDATAAAPGEWSCPLNLGPGTDDTLGARLLAEVGRLKTWSSQTRAERGRTHFGSSGAAPDQVDDVARALASVVEASSVNELPPQTGDDIEWAFEMPLLARHLADDLRTFYHEAIAAQPGDAAPNHDALNEWIFADTVLGETLLAVADRFTAADDPMANLIRGMLIPDGHYEGGSAF